jgi:hypothetical protein
VLQSSGGSSTQETTMTIRVRNVDGKPEEKWRQLLEVMRSSNSAPLGVILHGKEGTRGKGSEGKKQGA